MDWSTTLIKYILLIINVLFVLSGIILIAVGATIKAYYNNYDLFLSNSYFDLANLLIAIGAMIFIFAIVGIYGTFSEKWLIVFGFSILLAIIFIMELSGGIAGYALRDKTSNYLSSQFKEKMKAYSFNEQNPSDATILFDSIQRHFECCGADGPKDWAEYVPTTTTTTTTTQSPPTEPSKPTEKPASTESTPSEPPTTETKTDAETTTPIITTIFVLNHQNDLPGSCCVPRSGQIGSFVCNSQTNETATFYQTGCVKHFGSYLKAHAVTLGGTAIGIAVFQLLGVLLSYHLSMRLRNGLYTT